VTQTNSFLQSPFDDIAAQSTQDADALLPGQKPVKSTPQVEMQQAPAKPVQAEAAEPAPAATPKAAKAENWMPPADQMPIFEAAAQHFNVPVNVLMALGKQESSYRSNAIGVQTQWGRAKGIMQYLDGTAQGLGINPFDPAEAIPAAAKQLRERLDAGASMKDAVMEHFAGPDRKLWGAKTAAYGDEVMGKADRIGQMYTGGTATAEQPAAEAKPDLAALQQQLDAEEPGRYKVLPEGYAETHFSAAMPRDTYEQTFRSVNPGASQSAIDYAMKQYDEQAKAKAAQPAPTPAEDRFKALTATPEAQFDARLNQRLQGQPNGVVPPLPAKLRPEPAPAYDAAAADRESALSAAASYLGKSLKSGVYDLAGVGAKVLDEINPWTLSPSDAAVLFKDDPAKLKQFQDDSAAMILSRFAKRMTKNSEESMQEISPRAKRDYGSLEYATTDTSKAAYLSPTKVLGDAIRSLPTSAAMAFSVYLTRGAAARAEQTALAAGMTQEAAQQAAIAAGAKAMATTGAVSEGITGYAQQANQSAADAEKVPMAVLAQSPKFQQLLKKGFTPEAARAKIIADTGEEAGRMAGIVDAAVNHVGGEFLGKILTEGGKLIPRIMKGAANESATEFVQSAGEQLGQNKATRDNINPNQSLTEGVGEAAIAGAAVGGVMGGGMAGAGGKGAAISPAPAAAPAPAAPAPVVAAGTAPVAQASTAPGPLSRSVENAAEQHSGQENRVTATAPNGEQVSGQVAGYQEDADGNFVAQIVADDGTVVTLDSRTGVQIEPEATPDAGPLTASLTSAAERHAAEPAAEQAAPPAEAPAAPKPTPTIQEMTDEQLQTRLKYIASQAKESGWDKRFVDARTAVEREISKRASAAPTMEASNNAPVNDGGRSNLAAAPDGATDSGRSGADRPLSGYGSADAGVDGAQAAVDLPAASGAADAKPALKEWERNPYHAYTAGDQATAEAYMAKVKADPAKFEVKQTGKVRWQVVPKAVAEAEATATPEHAPAPAADLKSVSGRKLAKGWTAFKTSTGTLDIPRAKMPQVKSEHRGALTNFLNARGITHEQVEVPAGDLKPTQREFSAEKVAAAKDNAGGERSILISSDNHVLDGHHQWLAQMGSNEPVKAIRLNAPIRELLPQVHEFPSSMVEGGATKTIKEKSIAQIDKEFKERDRSAGADKLRSENENSIYSAGAESAANSEGRTPPAFLAGKSKELWLSGYDSKVKVPEPTGKMIQTVAGPMTVDAYADLPVKERPARTGGVGSSNFEEAKSRAEKEAQEVASRKESNRGKTIEQRRADSILDKPTRLPPSAGLGAGSRRDSMRMAVEQERAIVEKMVPDDAARKSDKDVIDRMTRAGYMIDHSNPNIPAVKAAREARDRLKADKYTKPEYRVYSGRDTNGSFFVITKTEYDYAQYIKAVEKVPEVAPKEQQAAPVVTDATAGGSQPAPAAKDAKAEQAAEVESIFSDMAKEGRAGARARTKAKKHSLAKQISEVESNFLDMLGQLDDAGLIAINC